MLILAETDSSFTLFGDSDADHRKPGLALVPLLPWLRLIHRGQEFVQAHEVDHSSRE